MKNGSIKLIVGLAVLVLVGVIGLALTKGGGAMPAPDRQVTSEERAAAMAEVKPEPVKSKVTVGDAYAAALQFFRQKTGWPENAEYHIVAGECTEYGEGDWSIVVTASMGSLNKRFTCNVKYCKETGKWELVDRTIAIKDLH